MSPLESDADTSSWRSRSHSEELLQSIGTASSVDSFIIEGIWGTQCDTIDMCICVIY